MECVGLQLSSDELNSPLLPGFIDRKPVGVIEAKKADEGQHLTAVALARGGWEGSGLCPVTKPYYL
jgi:hypothetical protein